MHLNSNQLTGSLPADWAAGTVARSLRELALQGNQLSGVG
jgi:hypothetical protein